MTPPALAPIHSLLDAHRAYRARALNLIASENAMSPAVEALFTPELSHRYGDYAGADVSARKYTGNRYLAALDAGASDAVRSLFGCRCADLGCVPPTVRARCVSPPTTCSPAPICSARWR